MNKSGNREFFCGSLPAVLLHGSRTPPSPGDACQPAAANSWWEGVDWKTYDAWCSGQDVDISVPYANIVWEYLGLRDPDRKDVPAWAQDARDAADLGQQFGILFVTDDRERAEALYGPVTEIDMLSPEILDVVPDPNARTHSGWILVMRAGAPLPILDVHDGVLIHPDP